MVYILNEVNKPVQVTLGSPEMLAASCVYATEAEAKQAQRENCKCETRIGNRATGRVTCADCGQLTDELVLVPRGLLGSACAAIRMKHDAPRTIEGLRAAAFGKAYAPSSVAATGIDRPQLDRLWREINNSCFDRPDVPPYVRLAEALSLLPQSDGVPPLPFSKGDTDKKGDCDIHAAGINVGDWGNRIEVYGSTGAEANALRDYLLAAISGKNEPDAEAEPIQLEAVGITRQDDDGLYVEWLLEGGISAIEHPGTLLLVASDAPDLCAEDGGAEVYLSPQAEQVLEQKLPAELMAPSPESFQAAVNSLTKIRLSGAAGYTDYTTHAGESLAGIAARELGDARRWEEVRDLNAKAFPDMTHSDYYPVGTTIRLPVKKDYPT